MKNLRKQIIIWLFEHSKRVYTKMFKSHQPWAVNRTELLALPKYTFGWHLGDFLKRNNFQLIPKVERHDCYHVLCGYSTKVEDEIALQCLCYGNGKRSPYLYGAIILGVLILPDYYKYYYSSFKVGKTANAFHYYNYEELLLVNFENFRQVIFQNRKFNS